MPAESFDAEPSQAVGETLQERAERDARETSRRYDESAGQFPMIADALGEARAEAKLKGGAYGAPLGHESQLSLIHILCGAVLKLQGQVAALEAALAER